MNKKKKEVTSENIEANIKNAKETNELKEQKTNKKNKTKIVIACILFLIVIISSAFAGLYIKDQNERSEAEKKEILKKQKEEKEIVKKINDIYAEIVYTKEETDLYKKDKKSYNKKGKIGKGVKLELEKLENITIDNEYLKITNIDSEYYIHYSNIMKDEEKKEDTKQTGMGSLSLRYKNYIPFNENVVTKETYSLYDTSDNFLYELNGSLNKPILIKKPDKYYFEYQNKLVYVKKEDTEKLEQKNNTNETPAFDMPVLLYHFFYDQNNAAEVAECNQIICISEQQFQTHLDYLKNNDFFTPNMDEFEMFIDGELRLKDKSVLITIDDGWYSGGGTRKLTEYGLNGTIFLITAAYEPKWAVTDYIEVHSHSDNMHQNWQCPTNTSAIGSNSQGGALLCWDEQRILDDLKASREKTYSSKAFCFPFFDYNDRALELVKKAGFTLGFIGGMRDATVGQNKLLIPRYSILSSDSVNTIASYIN